MDIDDRVSSPSMGMRSKKVSNLLHYLGVCNCRFYRFQGEEVTGLCSWDNLNKTDVIWFCAEARDMEAALKSTVEATSWMDWWTFGMKSLLLNFSKDTRLVHRLSLADVRYQLLVAKTALTLWTYVVLET